MSSSAIYLAYCPQNSTIIAHSIYQYLTEQDYPVFVDLEPAEQYDFTIASHLIAASAIFVPVLAPGTMELGAERLSNAIAEAARLERVIIPIIFGGALVRAKYMREPQFVPRGSTPISMLYGNFDEGMKRLTDTLDKQRRKVAEISELPQEDMETITRKIEHAANYPPPTLSQMMAMSKLQDGYLPKPPTTDPQPSAASKAQTFEERKLANTTRMIENMPANPLGYAQRGEVYEEMGRLEDALADYEQALKLKPAYSDYQLAVHRMRTALNPDDKPLPESPTIAASQRHKMDEQVRAAIRSRADQAFNQWDFDTALPLYEQLLESAPLDRHLFAHIRMQFAKERQGYSKAMKRAGQLQMQVDNYTRSIERMPNNAPLYISRAEVYAEARYDDLALADYRTALNLRPYDKELQAIVDRLEIVVAGG